MVGPRIKAKRHLELIYYIISSILGISPSLQGDATVPAGNIPFAAARLHGPPHVAAS
jgi:hypothetical protein